MAVLDLHLQFLVVAVGQIAADAADQLVDLEWGRIAHGRLLATMQESSPTYVSVWILSMRRLLRQAPLRGKDLAHRLQGVGVLRTLIVPVALHPREPKCQAGRIAGAR